MPIKDLEKLRKKTLRERTYEEVVPLIVTGELPSGGWVDEKQVIDKLRVKRPSIALAYMKDNLDHAVASEFLNSMDQEAKKMVRAPTTDHKEAVRAFIDKRKPAFSGQQDP